MWIRQIIGAVIGFSSGIVIAGGLFAFIIGLGVVSDFADRTHTGDHILLYEDCIGLGGIVGSTWFIFGIHVPGGIWLLPIFGILSGIFVGGWSMALAEILNVFPIFIRRLKVVKTIPWLILGLAIGKGFGALLYFAKRW